MKNLFLDEFTNNLSRIFERWAQRPILIIGGNNTGLKRVRESYIYALRELNFSVVPSFGDISEREPYVLLVNGFVRPRFCLGDCIVVHVFHDAIPYRSAGLLKRSLIWLTNQYWISRSDAIIAISNHARKQLLHYHYLKVEPEVVHNPIHEVGNNRKFCIWIGSDKSHKRFDQFKRLSELCPDLDFIAIGTKQLSVGNLYTISRVPESLLKTMYSSCKAVVVTSDDEGFGLVPGEAILENTTVFAPKLDVFKEVYDGNEHFKFFDSIESLAKVLK